MLDRLGYTSRWVISSGIGSMLIALVSIVPGPATATDDECAQSWSRALHAAGHWEVEYDLTGSEFETRDTPLGAGDATQTIGTGSMTIRFDADGVGPTGSTLRQGRAQIVQFALLQDFVVRSRTFGLRADVRTTVRSQILDARWDGNTESRLEPGAGAGSIDGATLTLQDPGLVGYRTVGSMLCQGVGCTLGRLPRGVSQRIDRAIDMVGFDALYFEPGGPALGAGFESNEIALPTSHRASPFLRLRGIETGRIYVPATTQRAASGGRCYSEVDSEPSALEVVASDR